MFNVILNLWDRWRKDRPEAWTDAERIPGGRRYPCLVIRNPQIAPINVTAIAIDPDLLEIWSANTLQAAARSWVGEDATAYIGASEERWFPIMVRGASKADHDVPCRITISWRSMRSPRRLQLPIIYETTPRQVLDQCEERP